MSSVSRRDESQNAHHHSHYDPAHNSSVAHAHTHIHGHNEGEVSPAEREVSPAEGEVSPAKGEESPAPFLLKYMLEHNMHHVEELHALVHQLEDAGASASADAVKRALEYYEQGNAELATAVEHL